MSIHKNTTILNPLTCGIYKDGGPRYKIDSVTGERTDKIDNDLLEQVDAYLSGTTHLGITQVSVDEIFGRRVLAPTYFDKRYNEGVRQFIESNNICGVTIGDLIDNQVIIERRGHGSPANDQRSGNIPYVKVSDIRGLRVNVNPTNLVSEPVAHKHWRAKTSGLNAWDLITPNRASSNIGEFAILLPGDDRIVLTKEVFVLRSNDQELYDPFYLLWALSLRVVRVQWRRIALMQTNREDCGNRYREIIIPKPPNKAWAQKRSEPFRSYFTAIAQAKEIFVDNLQSDDFQYIASVIPDNSARSQDKDDSVMAT